MKKIPFLPAAFAAMILTGCTSVDISKDAIISSDRAVAHRPALAYKQKSFLSESVSNRGNFTSPAGRKMAFTADVSIRVSDVKYAISDVRKQTNSLGGYVKTLNNNRLVLAIPVAHGDRFLETIGKMGEITNLRIDGSDVTEQVSDIRIRMENLEKSRKRLLALMDRTASVRDLTQVERELNRVTTELERLQAANKNLNNRISYVTISVTFFAHTPARITPTANVPLLWINQLGSDLQTWIAANQGKVTVPFRVVLPSKFFFAGRDYAVSGSNCNIRFREISNAVTDIRWYGKKYAGIAFYKDMITRALEVRFGKKVICNECKIDGEDALRFQVETKIYGTDYLYLLAVSVDDDTVKVIEAKGKKADLLNDMSIDGWKKMLDSVN